MAEPTINWTTKVITVPQSYLTLVSGSLYELNVNALRLSLKNIEDSEDGMSFPDTHRHNTQVTLAGVTYARTLEIINGYTVAFEDGQYTVRCVGANHNLADVKVANQVALIVGNAAGLITVTQGSGVTAQDKTDIVNMVLDEVLAGHLAAGTLGQAIAYAHKLLRNRQELLADGTLITFDDDGSTPLLTQTVTDKDGNAPTLRTGIPARRSAPQ